jgi:molecular chaperone DnaK
MKNTVKSIVGIDLGTSTSEIAVFEFGKPTIVKNREGNAITPSAIFQQPNGELVVGEAAYSNAGAVREFKRKMDTEERLQVGSRHLLPEECSALLLRYLLASFEEERQVEVDRAVITVPANWKDTPRRATMEAGRLAGIKVERLINEPTAAAMAFGARPEAEGKTIAVYDLGGGTFDVTILRIQDKVFDVVTSVGDDRLGGSDIDALLMQHVIQQLAATQKYTHQLGRNPRADHMLKLACEQTKKELSNLTESVVRIPFWNPSGESGKMVPVEVPIRRSTMEDLIEPFIRRSLDYLDTALRRAKLPREAIDDVVMVGGSTRIPAVRRRVAERMGKEPNTRDVNPDEAVALGAAIQAGISDETTINDDSYIIIDNVNNDLGIETVVFVNEQVVHGVFSTIIPKDEKVPTEKTEVYSTVADDQKNIEVKCFQGNSKWTAQNREIGEPIRIEELPSRPSGGVKINITFRLNVSEILDVKVQVDDTGIVVERKFEIGGARYSEAQQAERRATVDSMWQSSEKAGKYRRLIEVVEGHLRGALPAATAASLRTGLEQLKQAIISGDTDAADRADQSLSEVLYDLS